MARGIAEVEIGNGLVRSFNVLDMHLGDSEVANIRTRAAGQAALRTGNASNSAQHNVPHAATARIAPEPVKSRLTPEERAEIIRLRNAFGLKIYDEDLK